MFTILYATYIPTKKWEIRETCLRFRRQQAAELGLHCWQLAFVSAYISTPRHTTPSNLVPAPLTPPSAAKRRKGKGGRQTRTCRTFAVSVTSLISFTQRESERSVSFPPIYQWGNWYREVPGYSTKEKQLCGSEFHVLSTARIQCLKNREKGECLG